MRFAEFPVIGQFFSCARSPAPPIISPPPETLLLLESAGAGSVPGGDVVNLIEAAQA
jgi:hypothetical protein